MIEGLVLPDTEDPDTAPFWAAARDHKLVVQRCDGCGALRFYPQPYCGACRHPKSTWTPVSGRGRIWSYVIVHAPTLPAYAPFIPFPVAVIELAEDRTLRMIGNLVADETAAINSIDPATLSVGLPVQVVFQPVAPDVVLPRWRLVDAREEKQ